MHEASLARRLLAAAHNAGGEHATVTRIVVELAPGHLDPSALEMTMRALAAGTGAHKAVVEIRTALIGDPDTARLVSITVEET